MSTVQNIVDRALIQIGRLGPGRTSGPSESAASLPFLQAMLSSWQNDGLYIYEIIKAIYPLAAGTQSYTIGPTGATFTAPRPSRCEAAAVIIGDTPAIRQALRLATADEWNALGMQSDTSALPKVLYDDYAYPNSTLYLYPIPAAFNSSLEIFTWIQIPNVVALTDTFALPDGYEWAITCMLALILAPAFGKPVTKELAANAELAKATLQNKNKLLFPPPPMPVPPVKAAA
jgi:hypothetical protein